MPSHPELFTHEQSRLAEFNGRIKDFTERREALKVKGKGDPLNTFVFAPLGALSWAVLLVDERLARWHRARLLRRMNRGT